MNEFALEIRSKFVRHSSNVKNEKIINLDVKRDHFHGLDSGIRIKSEERTVTKEKETQIKFIRLKVQLIESECDHIDGVENCF